MDRELKDKVAIIGIGSTPVTFGIIAHLLQHGATVLVPAQSSHHLKLLQVYLAGFNKDNLVTMLTDLPDYDKAVDLTRAMIEEYGALDIVVFPFDYLSVNDSLSNISVTQWQRAVEENLAVYFISCRAIINAMKENGEGLFVAIIDTDSLLRQPHNTMTDMLMSGQIKMASSFFEEVKDTQIKFHHLFINNLETGINGKQPANEAITPDMVARYIISLYREEKQLRSGPFLFFMGKDYPGLHRYFDNN